VNKKKKATPIPKLVKKASELAQLWARLKDADSNGIVKCATCWKTGHYKEMQGGHFIERGKAATRLDQMNIHAQDAGCNLWGMKKASVILAYRQYLVERYGHDAVLNLEHRSKQVHKWSRIELEDAITELKYLIESKLAVIQ
jgi:hypothetical protein